MSDFSIVRNAVFKNLSKFYNLTIVDNAEYSAVYKKHLPIEVWKIETEIFGLNNLVTSIELFIVFTNDFPLEIPRIYLSNNDFLKYGYLPHVDVNHFVCTHDTDRIRTDINNPIGIVIECIEKAKQIIETGVSQSNFIDFQQEFLSYWEQSYRSEDKVRFDTLFLSDDETNAEFKAIKFHNKLWNSYKFFLYQEGNNSKRFFDVIDFYNINYDHVDCLFLKNINLGIPPYDFTNDKLIKIISSSAESLFDYKRFIKSGTLEKVILFSTSFKESLIYFGVRQEISFRTVRGFREKSLNPFDIVSKWDKNTFLERFYIHDITPTRLLKRTGVESSELNLKLVGIIGLGSLGSYLLSFINNHYKPDYVFIDPDVLRVDNCGRHFLGLEYVNHNKAIASKHYVVRNSPLQSVICFESNIVDVLLDDTNAIKVLSCDCLFVAIGNANIESWLANYFKSNYNKPTFFLWIEPFAIGGHMIYINPTDANYNKYFDNSLFRFNVLDSSNYDIDNPMFSMNESGCQTTFTPYSARSIVRYIQSTFEIISDLVDGKRSGSCATTFVGDISFAVKSGLKLSEFGLSHSEGELIIHEL